MKSLDDQALDQNHNVHSIVLKVKSKKDLTDLNLLELKFKENLSINEYSEFIQSNIIESFNSEELIHAIVSFKDGLLLPNKCDAHEPIREKFDKLQLERPVKWMSQPGSALYLEKNKGIKYICEISNKRFAPIWQKGILLKPKTKEPEDLCEIIFNFEYKSIVNQIEIIEELKDALCTVLATNLFYIENSLEK